MKYNLLGNTGLSVSELCLGTMTFGGERGGIWENIGKLKQKEVNDIIETSFKAGVNFIDTANVYSFGQSEQLIGKALKDLDIPRDEVVLATKVCGAMKPTYNSMGLSRYHILNSLEESLERLQTNHIDILYAHAVDFDTPIEEIMNALNDTVQSGKVRYIAVSNWYAWMVMKAQGIAEKRGWSKFIGMQYYYSIASRDIERELLKMAIEENIAVMPWSPLAGGFLSGKYSKDNPKQTNSRRDEFDFPILNKEKTYAIIDVMSSIAKGYSASIAQVALAWVRQQKGITSTIIGAKTKEQLKNNLESIQVELSTSDLEKLNEASALVKEYPEWMIDFQLSLRSSLTK